MRIKWYKLNDIKWHRKAWNSTWSTVNAGWMWRPIFILLVTQAWKLPCLPALPGPRRAALKASPFSLWGYALLSLVGRNWSLASYFFPSNPTLTVLQSTLLKHHIRPQWKHLLLLPVTYFICESMLAQCCSSPQLCLHISPPNAMASRHLSLLKPFGMPVPKFPECLLSHGSQPFTP